MERDRTRQVLFIDEHGKPIVYADADVRISVNDEQDATFIVFYRKIYEKRRGVTKEYWMKSGWLRGDRTDFNLEDRKGTYLSIRSVEVPKKYRKRGFGKMMYQILADFSGNDVCGICSYLPNRHNKRAVPKIYKRFGAITDGDYQFIDFQ
jgi:predicted GNAT family acetyltransferase